MAKPKGTAGIQNRHIYNRASYLYQAANYLANRAQESQQGHHHHGSSSAQERKAVMNLSRQVISDMRAVSLKAQIRQSPAVKQTICKFCDTLQIEGKTCYSTVENASKGGRKPWADVLVIRCSTCGNTKRSPISAPRQKRKALRCSESAGTDGLDASKCV